jgi:hypothetical protein
MKILFIVFSIMLALVSSVCAAPYIVCDIPPADQSILGVKGEVDGTVFTLPYTLQSGAVLIYDIGTLSPAKHSFTNIRFYNERGESPSVPFALPALPGSPSNTRLSP